MKKKKKAVWGWGPAKQTFKPTEAQKAAITAKFEPLVLRLKQNLDPLPEPQIMNHCVDVFTKWWSSYFYIMQKFKCPPEGSYLEGFESGIARLEFRGTDSFNLAYFRYTEEWFVVMEGLTLEECLTAVENDSWFQVF